MDYIALAQQDLIAGRLQFAYTDLASVLPHLKAGKVLPLAVDRKTSLSPGVRGAGGPSSRRQPRSA